MAAGQNFTTNESTKFVVDGKTAALPYSLTDYNVIIVRDRAKSTALQVYAYSKDTTKTNTDIVYSVVARDNQVITAAVNNGTLTIDQAKLVSSTNGAANVDAAFTTATAAVKFYDLAGNEVATRQAAADPHRERRWHGLRHQHQRSHHSHACELQGRCDPGQREGRF